jgi:hypothetical protein
MAEHQMDFVEHFFVGAKLRIADRDRRFSSGRKRFALRPPVQPADALDPRLVADVGDC